MSGQPSSYIIGRYKALLSAYKEAWSQPSVRCREDAIRYALSQRYALNQCISSVEATRQVCRLLRGLQPSCKVGGSKYTLIHEIYEEYKRLRAMWQFHNSSTTFVVAFAACRPHYGLHISYDRARHILDNIRKGKYAAYGITW